MRFATVDAELAISPAPPSSYPYLPHLIPFDSPLPSYPLLYVSPLLWPGSADCLLFSWSFEVYPPASATLSPSVPPSSFRISFSAFTPRGLPGSFSPASRIFIPHVLQQKSVAVGQIDNP